jgi:hypothetical protein
VALAVDGFVDGALDPAGSVSRDVRLSPEALNVRNHGLAVVAAVADGHRSVGQVRHGAHVVRLSGGEDEIVWQAASIHCGVDLGGQSSTRTANGVIRAPFLPPAACWRTRTYRGINQMQANSAIAPPALERAQPHALLGPAVEAVDRRIGAVALGQARHSEPVRNTQMPFTTRRSSARGTPRGLLGSRGAVNATPHR